MMVTGECDIIDTTAGLESQIVASVNWRERGI